MTKLLVARFEADYEWEGCRHAEYAVSVLPVGGQLWSLKNESARVIPARRYSA